MVNYTDLKLVANNSKRLININGVEVEVLEYLPIEDKYSLVMITLQQCKENGVYNTIKKEIFFNLNLIYMYTNLNFTEEEKENPLKLYDMLESNDVFNTVIEYMNEKEYENLLYWMEEVQTKMTQYDNSFTGVVNNLLTSFPENAKIAADIVDNFDPEKFENVVNFAKGIGMR